MKYNGRYLTIGPPGTGKTTWLGQQVRACLDSDASVLVSSLTKTAAAEVAGRDLPIPRDHIATLHAHAYRAIDRPPVYVKSIDDWNKTHPALPMTTNTNGDSDDPFKPRQPLPGDALYEEVDLLRHEMRPIASWSQTHQEFHAEWSDWKEQLGVIDFTDMIAQAIEHTTQPVHSPDVLLTDEAQDLSALEYTLLCKWAKATRALICVGDPDQALFTWRGADPKLFDDPQVHASHRKVLSQSYRIPRKVHRVAMHWIKQLSNYREVAYRARDEDGRAERFYESTNKSPWSLVQAADEAAERGETTMILASCGYMLDTTLKVLRQRGIPFANPWRTHQGAWNPLLPRARVTTTPQRLLAFVKPLRTNCSLTYGAGCAYCGGTGRTPYIGAETADFFDDSDVGDVDAEATSFVACPHCIKPDDSPAWTWHEFNQWASLLNSSTAMPRGAKKLIAQRAKAEPVTPVGMPELRAYLNREASDLAASMLRGEQTIAHCAEWFRQNTLASKSGVLAFPLAVLENKGADALTQRPCIFIGTIHSFKGGEADNVFIYPEVSRRAMEHAMRWGYDDITRMYYVALTRAKRNVFVTMKCDPCSVEIEL